MDVLAIMKGYRKTDGAYLGRAEVVAYCDCCTDLETFKEHHGADVAEMLHNVLQARLGQSGVLYLFDFTELEEVPDDEDDCAERATAPAPDDEDDCTEWVKTHVRWFD